MGNVGPPGPGLIMDHDAGDRARDRPRPHPAARAATRPRGGGARPPSMGGTATRRPPAAGQQEDRLAHQPATARPGRQPVASVVRAAQSVRFRSITPARRPSCSIPNAIPSPVSAWWRTRGRTSVRPLSCRAWEGEPGCRGLVVAGLDDGGHIVLGQRAKTDPRPGNHRVREGRGGHGHWAPDRERTSSLLASSSIRRRAASASSGPPWPRRTRRGRCSSMRPATVRRSEAGSSE